MKLSADKIESLDQALAEIFSEPRLISTRIEPALLDVDRAALAGIFSERLPITNNPEPSPPRLDHHALAQIFGEPHPAPIDPQPSPLSIDERSSPPLFQSAEPVANIVATAPSTNAESTRPRRVESLLDKMRYMFSIKTEPLPSSPENDSSSASQTEALSTELRGLDLDGPQPPCLVENGPSPLSNPLTELDPAVQTGEAVPQTDTARRHKPRSLPIDPSPTSTTEASIPQRATLLLAELPAKISTDTESPLPIGEKELSHATRSNRSLNPDQATNAVSFASPADTKSAAIQSRKTKPLPSDTPSASIICENDSSSLSNQPNRLLGSIIGVSGYWVARSGLRQGFAAGR